MGRRDDQRAALGARVRELDIAIGMDPLIEVLQHAQALPERGHRREQRVEDRGPDAGREPIDARVEVADDVAAVIAHEIT